MKNIRVFRIVLVRLITVTSRSRTNHSNDDAVVGGSLYSPPTTLAKKCERLNQSRIITCARWIVVPVLTTVLVPGTRYLYMFFVCIYCWCMYCTWYRMVQFNLKLLAFYKHNMRMMPTLYTTDTATASIIPVPTSRW